MLGFSFSRNPLAGLTLASAIIALLCSAMMLVVSLTSAWQQVELNLFDAMMVQAAPNKSEFPITIIGIDEASFAKLELQWPWPRRLHAKLIDKLSAEGASAIVFDVVFSEPTNEEDDNLLADSIRRAGNVVLAADRVYQETASVRQWIRLDPHKKFLDAGAQVGLATVTLDRDQVIRQIPESDDALWRVIVARLLRVLPEIKPNLNIPSGSFIRYAGSDHTFPYFSYHEVLDRTSSIPPGYFKDGVVIIGRDVKASPDVGSAQADLFATPFLASTRWLTPGAEVHANILETALGNKSITRVSGATIAAMVLLMTVTLALAMRRWHPLWSALAGVMVAAVFAGATWGMFLKWNLWMPVASTLAVIPMMYVSMGGRSYLAETFRRREITRVFSLYVAPQVVNHMITHPESIKLGGERRNLTIMFTDLAGFTTTSEQLSPEQVTHLLNRHFTVITDIVLENQGTVLSFIGDALLAIWGAPLDDTDPEFRAVSVAMAMQVAMQKLRVEFESEGLPAVNMRIGVHSGSAIVGNMGSARRFDYTAIGDDVNLAARLEGSNKLYGTGIMVSGDTAHAITGRIMMRQVDKIVVKGKSQAVEVFTPCNDPEVCELTKLAIGAFREREWDAATLLLNQLLVIDAQDHIAKLYLDRIANFRVAPPAKGWEGSAILDKL